MDLNCNVTIRVATIQCVDVSIYCLWCITIRWYIVQYKMESNHCSVLHLRGIYYVFFHWETSCTIQLGWPQCTIISLKQAMVCRYITIRDISIRFNFVLIHRYRLKTIQFVIYRYIVASLICFVQRHYFVELSQLKMNAYWKNTTNSYYRLICVVPPLNMHGYCNLRCVCTYIWVVCM